MASDCTCAAYVCLSFSLSFSLPPSHFHRLQIFFLCPFLFLSLSLSVSLFLVHVCVCVYIHIDFFFFNFSFQVSLTFFFLSIHYSSLFFFFCYFSNIYFRSLERPMALSRISKREFLGLLPYARVCVRMLKRYI